MIVVSPCFYPTEEPAAHLRNSCRRMGLDLLLYGVGQPFHAHGADAQVAKLVPVLEGLDDEYVVVTDCRDTLFLAGEVELMDEFRHYRTDLVMSAEKGCWPPEPEVVHGMPKTSLGYNYINAGQYMGKRKYILTCLHHLLSQYRKGGGLDNSQAWWPLALLRGELDFALDSKCRIFQTMSSGETYDLIPDRRILFHLTGACPCSVHFNGSQDRTAYIKLSEELYGQG